MTFISACMVHSCGLIFYFVWNLFACHGVLVYEGKWKHEEYDRKRIPPTCRGVFGYGNKALRGAHGKFFRRWGLLSERVLQAFQADEKGSLPNPKAWLIRVALNECRSVLRYRLRKNTVDLSSITSFSKDGSDIEILDLIFRLPPKYRDSIYLYYFEELSVQEIAELTNIKENTIKTHLKRGREQLKDMIMLWTIWMSIKT